VQASLRLDESEWSDKFSLDTVGDTGKIECKFKQQDVEVNLLQLYGLVLSVLVYYAAHAEQ